MLRNSGPDAPRRGCEDRQEDSIYPPNPVRCHPTVAGIGIGRIIRGIRHIPSLMCAGGLITCRHSASRNEPPCAGRKIGAFGR
jgi:hypothetical protein